MPAFVEVHPAPIPAAGATAAGGSKSAVEVPLELLLPGDRRLLIHASCDGSLLQRVVSALASASLPVPSRSEDLDKLGRVESNREGS